MLSGRRFLIASAALGLAARDAREDFSAFIATEAPKWAAMARLAGVEPD